MSRRKAQSSAQQGLQSSRVSWLVLTKASPANSLDNEKFQYIMISDLLYGLQVCVSFCTNSFIVKQCGRHSWVENEGNGQITLRLTRLSHLLSLCFQSKLKLRQLYKILSSLTTNLPTATLTEIGASQSALRKEREEGDCDISTF